MKKISKKGIIILSTVVVIFLFSIINLNYLAVAQTQLLIQNPYGVPLSTGNIYPGIGSGILGNPYLGMPLSNNQQYNYGFANFPAFNMPLGVINPYQQIAPFAQPRIYANVPPYQQFMPYPQAASYLQPAFYSQSAPYPQQGVFPFQGFNPYAPVSQNPAYSNQNPYNVPNQLMADISLDSQNDGEFITIQKDQTLSINLDTNPSTGERWEIDPNSYNNTILIQISKQVIPQMIPYQGVIMIESWFFKAVASGITTIFMEYKNPFVGEATRTFTVIINVEE